MTTILLIDGNSIGHANHNATRLTVGNTEVQAIFGFAKSIRGYYEQFAGAQPVVLWDGRAQWRYDIYPEYKGKRKEATEKDPKRAEHKANYERQVPLIKKMLTSLGVRQVVHPEYEADDLAGLLVKRLQGRRVVLVSGDQDWLQLISPSVTWFDPIRDHKVTPTNLFEFSGYYTPREFLEGKALRGDSSDSISGVGGMGEVSAREFMATHRGVQQFWTKVDSGVLVPKKRKSKTATSLHPEEFLCSAEGRQLFDRNMRLMNLSGVPEPASGTLKIDKGEFNPDIFQSLCERLAFQSILRDWQHFTLPFASDRK